MIKLEDKPGVQAPDATWPFGRSLDRAPGVNGLPLNSASLEDYHQFFAKLFDASGLTANGLPDNEDNGFQMFDALLAVFGGLKRKTIEIGAWNMDADTSTTAAHGIADFSKIRSVNAFILRDDSLYNTPLAGPFGAVSGVDATNVELLRVASGIFDNSSYDDAVMNRGFIVIEYII